MTQFQSYATLNAENQKKILNSKKATGKTTLDLLSIQLETSCGVIVVQRFATFPFCTGSSVLIFTGSCGRSRVSGLEHSPSPKREFDLYNSFLAKLGVKVDLKMYLLLTLLTSTDFLQFFYVLYV